MQSLKSETDQLLTTISKYETDTKDANSKNDQHEADIRDLGKKIQGYECDFDETNDKLTKALAALEEKEKAFKNAEEEARKADSSLAETVTKLAMASKDADGILKKVKY